MKKKISISISDTTLKGIDSVIDNVYIRSRSQAIEYLLNNTLSKSKVAVILCGGPTKHLEIGNGVYRPTAKIKGKSVIELSIQKLKENGFKEIHIIAQGKVLTEIFNIVKDGSDYGIKIHYVEEKKSNGSFDSLKHVSNTIKTNFLVVYGDIIFDKVNIDKIWNHHLMHNGVATIMMTTSSKPSEKGILKVEGTKVLEFTQKSRDSDIYLVFSPIFACEPEIFSYTGHSLERDVFPYLAQKSLLEGHLSSEKEHHIHSTKDTKKI